MSALQDLLDAPDRAVETCSHRARRLLERRMFGADGVECREELAVGGLAVGGTGFGMATDRRGALGRPEEHTSELQSLMRTSYDVVCLEHEAAFGTSYD